MVTHRKTILSAVAAAVACLLPLDARAGGTLRFKKSPSAAVRPRAQAAGPPARLNPPPSPRPASPANENGPGWITNPYKSWSYSYQTSSHASHAAPAGAYEEFEEFHVDEHNFDEGGSFDDPDDGVESAPPRVWEAAPHYFVEPTGPHTGPYSAFWGPGYYPFSTRHGPRAPCNPWKGYCQEKQASDEWYRSVFCQECRGSEGYVDAHGVVRCRRCGLPVKWAARQAQAYGPPAQQAHAPYASQPYAPQPHTGGGIPPSVQRQIPHNAIPRAHGRAPAFPQSQSWPGRRGR